eukprot:1698079-Prymnesium_polylepis.1
MPTTQAQRRPQGPPRPSGVCPAWAQCYALRQPPPATPTPTRHRPRRHAAACYCVPCGSGRKRADRAPAAHGRSRAP